MKTPTVGAGVWYRPHHLESAYQHDQPFAATILHVWTDTVVGLSVLNECDMKVPHKTSITLNESWGTCPPGECAWPTG